MNLAKIFFVISFLLFTSLTLAETHKASKEPHSPSDIYRMSDVEAKVLAETKAYLEAGGKVDAVVSSRATASCRIP